MSFTAEVKDELSRVRGTCELCDTAELSALVRVCGTLSFHGSGRYSIRISTETGAVARMVIKLSHEVFDLDTNLTVRRSVLHKTRNYLIEIPQQAGLEEALYTMGILEPGVGIASHIPQKLIQKQCCRRAYLRGAFMAGGFVADPRSDFHLEIAVTGENYAQDLAELLATENIHGRLNHRRGAFALYMKSFEDTALLLSVLGAQRSARAVATIRRVKSVKNDVNRRVNAEMANQARSTASAADQLTLITRAEKIIGLRKLPPAVREFCEFRKEFPELSLRDLGKQCSPQLSKSALYHRLLRLQTLVAEAEASLKSNEG